MTHPTGTDTEQADRPPAAAAQPADWLEVTAMDLDAQGVARREDGKVVFIEGALIGERVGVQTHRRKNNWEQGTLTVLHRESAQRVDPGCPHFGLHTGACGGCKMQHLHPAAQIAVKQRVLEDNLWHLSKVRADTVSRPIEGPAWGYRYRARLSVRHVRKKGEVLIGFHERKSRYIADMSVCPVLPPHVSAMLLPLRALIHSLEARETCPQIELACGDRTTAMVLRHLEPLSAADRARLVAFGRSHGVQWWLQPKGPDTVHLLEEAADGVSAPLDYALPEFDVVMPFRPTDFTQVNPHINRVLVARALRLLDVRPDERVIDWFCGLGNFTLPLATQAASVLGIEGSETLVARSRENYARNRARSGRPMAPTDFVARNLFDMTPATLVADGNARKWLVDPPREGAFALCKALMELEQRRRAEAGESAATSPQDADGMAGADGHSPAPAADVDAARFAEWQPPERIVYVSCNPATLARDAGLLVHQAGYRCVTAGVVNMFPHTAHVESIAVFERRAD
ncbi:MAG: 23S rRNA (uracil(1939)-C(5))-methyltransferase RlmD [Xylophilus ampelinus]